MTEDLAVAIVGLLTQVVIFLTALVSRKTARKQRQKRKRKGRRR